MNLRQKISYLDNKFNVPMYAIMQMINICKKRDIDITEIETLNQKNK